MANIKTAEEVRIRRIHLAVTEAEYQWIKEEAENAGLTISSYIRMIVVYRGNRKRVLTEL